MIPCSALLTGIGLYARKRKKPMWFWSGSTVDESELINVPAYNKANGNMWIIYSIPYWICTFIGIVYPIAAVIILFLWCIGGIAFLISRYKKIYNHYKKY